MATLASFPDQGHLDMIRQRLWSVREFGRAQCLYALGRLDYAAVRSHLASWPTDTLSAFWGTKKAAILAEIGRVPAATATAEAALSAIRGRQQTVPGDFGLLSQEGWTMLLLRQLTLDARFAEPRVFPRIADATPAEKSQALALLRDVDAAGASSTPAIPSAIYVGMEPLEAVRRLRTELLNSSTPTVVDAIRGIQYWVYNLSTGGLQPPHAALIDDLVHLVALRRSPALVSALTVLSDVVKRVPYLLTDDHWQIISAALNFLERDTSLQASDIETSMDEVATIELEERPACRLASASLAHAISTMDRQSGQEGLREVVEPWRVAVSVDRLPEVRKAWSD